MLVDGGVVYESAIINEYLEEKYPSVRLLPGDPLERARIRIWIDFMNSRVHAAAHDLARKIEPEKAQANMQEHLEVMERALAGRDFIAGGYSLADVTFIPFYTRLERYGVSLDEQFPNLKRWGERLIARPAVAATL